MIPNYKRRHNLRMQNKWQVLKWPIVGSLICILLIAGIIGTCTAVLNKVIEEESARRGNKSTGEMLQRDGLTKKWFKGIGDKMKELEEKDAAQ